jgi:predicted glycoside hydrolase/deacetylase ChbG (UPF0249 family)
MRVTEADGNDMVVASFRRAQRHVIVNADDFGLSEKTNDGILQAHREGIVTSASLMVRQAASADAARRARSFPGLGVGLHVDVGEWCYRDGSWIALYEVVPTQSAEALADEVQRQLTQFEKLVGRAPAHLDSHQHAHRYEPLRSVMIAMASKLNVPLRFFKPRVRYCGDFYGQTAKGEPLPGAISVESLVSVLQGLAAGISEIACHPGLDDNLSTMYVAQRKSEVETLCDPRVRAAVAERDVELVSFVDVPRLVKEKRL